jgi:hypothetical protein
MALKNPFNYENASLGLRYFTYNYSRGAWVLYVCESAFTGIDSAQTGSAFVEMFLVLVHPYFSDSSIIARDEIAHAGIRERHVFAAVDVPDAGTRRVHHRTVALPHLKRETGDAHLPSRYLARSNGTDILMHA